MKIGIAGERISFRGGKFEVSRIGYMCDLKARSARSYIGWSIVVRRYMNAQTRKRIPIMLQMTRLSLWTGHKEAQKDEEEAKSKGSGMENGG